ncbi:methyl-accepting chemotaxis protein [Cytobacillus firmus]|uniref:methyl-accepting chemotaxis protein n=1 Tax=Cytobacillus firmus TaxID=1399 RepID=UPI0018CF1441|nr:methyl-accepting chemotaxis protein [Cytobacillus firmus]MBG9587604.1 hypothetical protein [Cytobacillus firmus]
MKKYKLNPTNSLKTQIFIYFMIPILLVTICTYFSLDYTKDFIVKNHVLPQFSERLKVNGEKLIQELDLSLLKDTINEPDKSGKQLKKKLDEFIKKNKGLEYVYVLTQVNDDEVIVALNGSDEYMVKSTFTSAQREAFKKDAISQSTVYKDKWGTHKSIFIPINKAKYVIGLDMDASFIEDINKKILSISSLFIILSLAISAFISIILGRKIVNPVDQLIESTNVMIEGDLSKPLVKNSENEVGILLDSFEIMRNSLSQIINNVKQSSFRINNESKELVYSFNEISIASQQIAESIDTEVTSAEEFTNKIERILFNTENINKLIINIHNNNQSIRNLTNSGISLTDDGNKQIKKVITQISKVKDNGLENSENLKKLDLKFNDINKIIELIKGISSQTTLLALNASIEAARAGESGKGFAVVAQEVQKLAYQTDESVNEISQTINDIINTTQKIISINNEDYQDIIKAVSLSEKSGDIFTEILNLVKKLVYETDVIVENAEEIKEASKNSVKFIEAVANTSDQRAATIQEISAAVVQQSSTLDSLLAKNKELKVIAETQKEVVSKFTI